MKFSNFVPGVGLLTPCIVPSGGFLYRMIVPGVGGLSGGMVMDEIDTCIRHR